VQWLTLRNDSLRLSNSFSKERIVLSVKRNSTPDLLVGLNCPRKIKSKKIRTRIIRLQFGAQMIMLVKWTEYFQILSDEWKNLSPGR